MTAAGNNNYYDSSKSKYLAAGIVMLAAGSSLAVVLNVQGAACLTQLARLDSGDGGGGGSSMPPSPATAAAGRDELERNCFIVTNSYTYSLFAAVIGAVLVAYHYYRKDRDKKKRH
ncbi:hypothetical protein [Nitrososphaera sp.]|uniref:hypothetical protein n=1 Tax=Nitrososphaera sp. TaxID=1971748 RepID=UPI00307F12AB